MYSSEYQRICYGRQMIISRDRSIEADEKKHIKINIQSIQVISRTGADDDATMQCKSEEPQWTNSGIKAAAIFGNNIVSSHLQKSSNKFSNQNEIRHLCCVRHVGCCFCFRYQSSYSGTSCPRLGSRRCWCCWTWSHQ